ncbi:MAG: VWA domain-containing protein [Chloroflexi bacterium]|nr:VWA domain-containing protein [Chloroflexota bacterium]
MSTMDRLIERSGWMFFVLLTGVAAIFAGRWMFAGAACQRFQDVLLFACAAFAVISMLIYALTAEDSFLAKLKSVVFVLVFSLFIPAVGGPFLVRLPEVQNLFCAPDPCLKVAQAKELHKVGELKGAEVLIRQCLAETSDAQCRAIAEQELIRLLSDQAGVLINDRQCDDLRALLEEAESLTRKQGADSDLARTVQARKEDCQRVCAAPPPTVMPTPTPSIQLEVLRKQREDNVGVLDVRVWRDGKQVSDLPRSAFQVKMLTGTPLTIRKFEEWRPDEPVCLIAVVDTSGSVEPGIPQIRQALQGLNDNRKPDDELGLVLFAGPQDIRPVQSPSKSPLNTSQVDRAVGSTALWDGVLEGLAQMDRCTVQLRYLVVMTDGSDNASQRVSSRDNIANAKWIAQEVNKKKVALYTVGVKSNELQPEPLRLAATSGTYTEAADFTALTALFQKIFGSTRDFYRIQFGMDPTQRMVTLRALDATEVNVEFAD